MTTPRSARTCPWCSYKFTGPPGYCSNICARAAAMTALYTGLSGYARRQAQADTRRTP
jgi:hypothetical protein